MKQRTLLLFFAFVFWTIFFLTARGLFLLYFSSARAGLSFPEIMAIFEHGISMDFSAAAYATAFTGLVLGLFYFRTGIQLWPFWMVVHVLLLVVASLVIVYDLAAYPAWNYRIDVRTLGSFSEITSIHSVGELATLLAVLVVFAGTGLFLLQRIFRSRFYSLRATALPTLPVILTLTALLVIPMRGSLSVVSMNASFAYSHATNRFANHAGVNAVWNFASSLTWPTTESAAPVTPGAKAVYAPADVADSLSTLVKGIGPNVIILVIDRFPAEFIGALGGRSDVTPRFNALVSEGALFDQFFSNSKGISQGLPALLNSDPSDSPVGAMVDVRRAQGLPFLNKAFKALGYRTGFTYGGWATEENLRAYLFNAGFDSITNANQFVAERRTGRWGVPDEFVFGKFSDEVFHDRQPFFRVMMAQSTRRPYDAPMETVFKGQDEEAKFMNAMHYADRWLGNFVDQAKKTLWWQNTLIIVTSGQGEGVVADAASAATPSRIPMLWLGGAMTQPGKVIHAHGNQTDLCNTLLSQLGHPSDNFSFSRNILAADSNRRVRADYAAIH